MTSIKNSYHDPQFEVAEDRIHLSDYISEYDWIYLSDYMDAAHVPPLCALLTCANVSPSSLGLQVQWVLLLHYVAVDVQRMVIEMLHDGRILKDGY